MKRWFGLFGEALREWSNDKVPRLAAALAYYTLFSLAPLLVIAVAIAGFALGEQAARGEIVATAAEVIGPEAAQEIETMIANAGREGGGLIASIIGLVVLFFGASGTFTELRQGMNQVWGIDQTKGGLRKSVVDRVFSFAMVMSIGFLLLVSLVVSAVLSAAGRLMADALPLGEWILQLLNVAVSIAVITGLFALMFRYLPDERIAWRNVWAGALFTAVLFVIGMFLIGLYLGKATVGSAFGAAGALAVILVWIYYSGLIFYFGAELTEVYARSRQAQLSGEESKPRPRSSVALSPSLAASLSSAAALAAVVEPEISASPSPEKRDRGGIFRVAALAAAGFGGMVVGVIAAAVGALVLITRGARKLLHF